MRIRAREAAREGRESRPRCRWTPLEEICPHLVQAVLAGEDVESYHHRGFDSGARYNARQAGGPRGPSTITQQTVKTLYLSPDRRMGGKPREAIFTWWMEPCPPKSRILELYLSPVERGPGIFGIAAATGACFGESVGRLSWGHAALLAAAPPAPLVRNPPAPRLRSAAADPPPRPISPGERSHRTGSDLEDSPGRPVRSCGWPGWGSSCGSRGGSLPDARHCRQPKQVLFAKQQPQSLHDRV